MSSRPKTELFAKLNQLRLVITDCDGVLTDGGVYYSDSGDTLRRFNVRDGMGVERLRNALGIETCLLSGEDSDALRYRADKLHIRECLLGIRDKRSAVYGLADRNGYGLDQIGYIGDDINDLGAMSIVGFSACPADACATLHLTADYICRCAGGQGAFREFAELIVHAQQDVANRQAYALAMESYEDEGFRRCAQDSAA